MEWRFLPICINGRNKWAVQKVKIQSNVFSLIEVKVVATQ